jgi:methylmalonyl-CoA mutase, N-terminal domain
VLRRSRSGEEVQRRLRDLRVAASQQPEARSDGQISGANTMPFVVETVRAYATVGEINDVLHEVYGIYTETNAT